MRDELKEMLPLVMREFQEVVDNELGTNASPMKILPPSSFAPQTLATLALNCIQAIDNPERDDKLIEGGSTFAFHASALMVYLLYLAEVEGHNIADSLVPYVKHAKKGDKE